MAETALAPHGGRLTIQPNAYYTLDEAAGLLRVPTEAVVRLVETGRARAVTIGEHWRVLGAALLDLSSADHESEAALVSDWLAASGPALEEVWDNEEDAAYDAL